MIWSLLLLVNAMGALLVGFAHMSEPSTALLLLAIMPMSLVLIYEYMVGGE